MVVLLLLMMMMLHQQRVQDKAEGGIAIVYFVGDTA